MREYDENESPRRERTDPSAFEPEEEAPKRPKRRRRRRRRSRHVLRNTLLLLLFAALALLLLGTPPVRNPGGLARQSGHSTILLAGTDVDGWRTDTIMLLSLTQGEGVRLLSIPRDTYVPYYTTYKLNAVYGAGGGASHGMELLLQEVGHILGFAPDGYVLVDMDTVARAVDLLGGVDYTVPQDMDCVDYDQEESFHLYAGPQHLDGQQVIGLLRYRAGYADADIGRTAVQRDFLREALSQWLTPRNIRYVPQLFELFRANAATSLSFRNAMWILRVLVKSDLRGMVTEVLPGWPDMVEGSAVYMIYQEAAAPMLKAYNPYQ